MTSSEASLPRPLRSVLYVPASHPRALRKAETLDVDGLILDLEDAVAPEAKESARNALVAALAARRLEPRVRVARVNALTSPFGADDIGALAHAEVRPDALLLPKVEGAGEVRAARERLAAGGAPPELALWAMIETPRAAFAALEIARELARASPGRGALVLGTADLALALGAREVGDREPFLFAMQSALYAARAEGLAALDGVHLDIEDEEGLERACRQAAAMGFEGKTLIHPKQAPIAQRTFAPSEAELAWAEKVLEAWAEAREAGRGVAIVEGRLVEELHVREAERRLALAEALRRRAMP